jgi:hypothetical protein
VADQVDNTVAVAPLVVIPRDKLDKVVVKSYPSLGVEDARPKQKNVKRNNEHQNAIISFLCNVVIKSFIQQLNK